MPEPVWLREELILFIHRRQILQHGGSLGLRDRGLLEASLARPRQVYAYGQNVDIARLAGLPMRGQLFATIPLWTAISLWHSWRVESSCG